MRPIIEYLSTKIVQSKIKATEKTIKKIIQDELDRLGHDANLNHIDVSEVKGMPNLFNCDNWNLGPKYKDLNPDISKWDVSNVENMDHMFTFCENFNCDISQWIVKNVITMESMFCGCENFNQDISSWNVGKVEDMSGMFCGCENFNQDLSSWDVQKVLHSNRVLMFKDCPIREEFKPKFKK